MVTAPILLAYIRTPSSLNNYYTPFLEMMYDLIGCILFLTVGGLVLENYKNHVVDMKPNEPGVALGVVIYMTRYFLFRGAYYFIFIHLLVALHYQLDCLLD